MNFQLLGSVWILERKKEKGWRGRYNVFILDILTSILKEITLEILHREKILSKLLSKNTFDIFVHKK